ncbi:MAG TPA: hypothetical protein VK155_11450 [Bacteroidales bacterium]|jgi:hypothetical protein|nr:hypothetical protein [Bacteroidales bacterium]
MLNAVQWISRVACMLFILFISMFAFDVFDQGAGFWRTTGALLLHLLPSFVMTTVLVISWKRPMIGSIFFLILAISYIAWTSHGKTYLIIAVPLLVISALFLLSHWLDKSAKR